MPLPVYQVPSGYATNAAVVALPQPVYQIPMEQTGAGPEAGGEGYLEVRGAEFGVYGTLAPDGPVARPIVAEKAYNRLSGAGVPDLVADQPMYSVLVAPPNGTAAPAGEAGANVYAKLGHGSNSVLYSTSSAASSAHATTGSTA